MHVATAHHPCQPLLVSPRRSRRPSCYVVRCPSSLRALATETTRKLDVLALDGDTLGVNGAEVGIFEERNEICLDGLLEGTDG